MIVFSTLLRKLAAVRQETYRADWNEATLGPCVDLSEDDLLSRIWAKFVRESTTLTTTVINKEVAILNDKLSKKGLPERTNIRELSQSHAQYLKVLQFYGEARTNTSSSPSSSSIC